MGVIADLLESPYLVEGVVVALAIVFLSTYYGDFADGFAYRNIPIVGWNTWELTNKKAKNRFLSSAKELIAEGFAQVRTYSLLHLSSYVVSFQKEVKMGERKNSRD